jgi:hypothetical protein
MEEERSNEDRTNVMKWSSFTNVKGTNFILGITGVSYSNYTESSNRRLKKRKDFLIGYIMNILGHSGLTND